MNALTRNVLESFELPDISKHLASRLEHSYLCHRPDDDISFDYGVTKGQYLGNDESLVKRIITAYQGSFTGQHSTVESMWFTWIGPMKEPIHEALMEGDFPAVTEFLRDPSSSHLFQGFDNLVVQDDGSQLVPKYWARWMAGWTYDALRRLTEAVGARPMAYPEGSGQAGKAGSGVPAPDELLRDLDDSFGFRIDFPNPFQNEVGIPTSRGTATYRAVHALYQAWRVKQLVEGKPDAKVLEIGAGLGRSAYYARKMGIKDYTLIDLHMTNVSQAYYLGTLCGYDSVILHGEDGARADAFKIMPPDFFLEGLETYDLIVNVDSFTEMSFAAASAYMYEIKKRARCLLSINHEANEFTVAQMVSEIGEECRSRTPSWIRKGYVEEVVYLLMPNPEEPQDIATEKVKSGNKWWRRLAAVRQPDAKPKGL
ncbi:hypothetical protein E2F50_13085 [Rhizobium deserti]|uniref:Sugar O-methyltransferase n=1 Tax=Rhizobium deserti TaxID=2547961 RepID=A0A4R5UGX5_9HYPH|nr:hypothetical protein [Rhizobium deserti]TDK35191.1 hypothetical protein E2F50_13085 [Rhizobium deserti]